MECLCWIEVLDVVVKLVIVVIYGYCMGGGLELVLVCDICFVVLGVVFVLLEIGLGLIFGGGGIQCLVWVVVLGLVMDLLFIGEWLNVEEVCWVGLVIWLVCDVDSWFDEVIILVWQIVVKLLVVLVYVKQVVCVVLELDFKCGFDLELDLFVLLVLIKDRFEVVQVFVE